MVVRTAQHTQRLVSTSSVRRPLASRSVRIVVELEDSIVQIAIHVDTELPDHVVRTDQEWIRLARIGAHVLIILNPLRARAAAWANCSADDITHALIAEYPPGSQLGWHRDVPEFELVLGISLGSPCRMRFRRYPPRFREKSIALDIEPRSIYRLQGEARWEWQHAVPAVRALRYSITFRTLRAKPSIA